MPASEDMDGVDALTEIPNAKAATFATHTRFLAELTIIEIREGERS
jgi:hypothetical protein